MSAGERTATREELYEAVWSTPISKLAKEWNVPAAGIAKACETLNVPRPASGHWSLVRQGWQVERAALSPADETTPGVFTIKPQQKRRLTPQRGPAAEQAAAAPASAGIVAAENLDAAHPLVRRMRKLLKGAKADRQGKADAPWREMIFQISVAPSNVERALRILDPVVKEVEKRGGRFQKDAETAEMKLYVEGELVGFRIFEGLKRRPLTDQDRKEHFCFDTDVWRMDASGELRFEVKSREYLFRDQVWKDGKRESLESKLGEIVDALIAAGSEAKESRAQRLEENRRSEEESERRAAQYRAQETENGNRAALVQQAHQWFSAQNLRAFVDGCERTLRVPNAAMPSESWGARWLE